VCVQAGGRGAGDRAEAVRPVWRRRRRQTSERSQRCSCLARAAIPSDCPPHSRRAVRGTKFVSLDPTPCSTRRTTGVDFWSANPNIGANGCTYCSRATRTAHSRARPRRGKLTDGVSRVPRPHGWEHRAARVVRTRCSRARAAICGGTFGHQSGRPAGRADRHRTATDPTASRATLPAHARDLERLARCEGLNIGIIRRVRSSRATPTCCGAPHEASRSPISLPRWTWP